MSAATMNIANCLLYKFSEHRGFVLTVPLANNHGEGAAGSDYAQPMRPAQFVIKRKHQHQMAIHCMNSCRNPLQSRYSTKSLLIAMPYV